MCGLAQLTVNLSGILVALITSGLGIAISPCLKNSYSQGVGIVVSCAIGCIFSVVPLDDTHDFKTLTRDGSHTISLSKGEEAYCLYKNESGLSVLLLDSLKIKIKFKG